MNDPYVISSNDNHNILYIQYKLIELFSRWETIDLFVTNYIAEYNQNMIDIDNITYPNDQKSRRLCIYMDLLRASLMNLMNHNMIHGLIQYLANF